jgi:predicted DNA-binding transcriptional regulator
MKVDLLGAVANQGEVEAREVAVLLGLSPAAAAMALLRAYRAGLLARTGANGGIGFIYALTEKGWLRLHYLASESEPTFQTPSRHRESHGRRTRRADEEALFRELPLS